MQALIDKQAVIKQLQAKINAMQGLGKPSGMPATNGFAPFSDAFPSGAFPMGALHEFVSYEPADAASTSGFITALAGIFMKSGGLSLWIGSERKIFPLGLKPFGLEPDRVIFIKTPKHKDMLWTIEEALKCESLTAVIGEIKELSFTESRRLQLAVERSGVNCFIHRFRPRAENALACTTRWKITPVASQPDDNLPGVGHSCWDVQLIKVKNGRPDSWQVIWSNNKFLPITQKSFSITATHERHAG
ncbi:MAG TPA: hypothetical protein VF676_01380 [Flavobacterium sp.]|jgi:protein ImuA